MSAKKPSITTTRNYRLFHSNIDNRDLKLGKHRRLKESMHKYGFLHSFPIVCYRNGTSQLQVRDGQHRLAFAEELSLPVSYIVEEKDFDIAEINSAAVSWSLIDYAQKWAKHGLDDYQEAIDFSQSHRIPIGMAFGILYGEQTAGNIRKLIISGGFRVKDREFSESVAKLYSGLVDLSTSLRNASCLAASVAVCRVPEFDIERLLHGAKRCRDRLVSYSTRDAYLDLFEELYNFNRTKLIPLKMPAVQALRERSAVEKKKAGKKKSD